MNIMETPEEIAAALRKEIIDVHRSTKLPHIGSELSCLDILSMLYFGFMGPEDIFVLSKGHAAIALYSILHKKGILSDDVYKSLGQNGSILPEHPPVATPGIEFATGSLGHGLAFAVGRALGRKINRQNGLVIALLSDGECEEGSTYEAMNFASRFRLGNLVAFIDSNKWTAYDRTDDLLPKKKIARIFKGSGWAVKEIDGHDMTQIRNALESSSAAKRPTVIVANTTLGKGLAGMEDKLETHYRPPQ